MTVDGAVTAIAVVSVATLAGRIGLVWSTGGGCPLPDGRVLLATGERRRHGAGLGPAHRRPGRHPDRAYRLGLVAGGGGKRAVPGPGVHATASRRGRHSQGRGNGSVTQPPTAGPARFALPASAARKQASAARRSAGSAQLLAGSRAARRRHGGGVGCWTHAGEARPAGRRRVT